MEEKLAWAKFLKTGKIEDYLKYRQIHNEIEIAREFNDEKRKNQGSRNCLKDDRL